MAVPDPLQKIAEHFRQVTSGSPMAEAERNARALLTSLLGRLDLVTREEFDAQAAVLARTRERLEELERRLARLEAPSDEGPGAPPA